MGKIAAAAVAGVLSVGVASAATYDFAAGANGVIGESIWSTFNTDDFYTGPNLEVTAFSGSDNDVRHWVYLDAGTGGMGVCKDRLTPGTENTAYPNSTANLCNPGSDDGLTTDDEVLTFKATEAPVRITEIVLNALHDPQLVTDATYSINGMIYDLGAMFPPSDRVALAVNIVLNVGDFFSLSPVRGSPNSYVEALTLNEIPVPAAGFLLLGGLGGMVAMKRRRKN